jgi:hypothetical protein
VIRVILVETRKSGRELLPEIQAAISREERDGGRLVSTELYGSVGMWLFFEQNGKR